jgi:hypothetical protein
VSHLVAIAILAVGTLLVLLGIAERIIRGRAVSWPVAEGKIDSAPIEEFKGKRHHWTVRLNYSFLVYGKRYTGRYSRRFDYEDGAQSWAHHLQGKTVLVRHSPKWAALSLILDDDLESVLNPSPPEPAQPPICLAWRVSPGLES